MGCWPCGITHLRGSVLHQAESALRECVILDPSLANVQAGKNSVHRLPLLAHYFVQPLQSHIPYRLCDEVAMMQRL